MGAAAIPYIMLGTAVAQTAVSFRQSSMQSAAIDRQAAQQQQQIITQREQEQAQIESDAKEAEILRLRALRDTLSNNIVSTVGSGITIEGTPATIIEGNIEAAREDINIIRDNAEAGISTVELGAAMESQAIGEAAATKTSALSVGRFGSIIGGIGAGASAFAPSNRGGF